jgi:hypothetical protein
MEASLDRVDWDSTVPVCLLSGSCTDWAMGDGEDGDVN